MSDAIEALKIAASIMGGGAVGAIITALVTTYRNRVQPVGRRVEVAPLFTASFGGSTLNPSITVSDGTTEYKLPNLYVADIQLVNRGNHDLAAFTFGVTLDTSDLAVHVEPYGLDRHHMATLMTPVTPIQPSRILDFALKPLNRGDSYTLKVFIVASSGEPGPIVLGSSEPIRFTEIPSLADAIAKLAVGSVKIGPLEVLFPR